MEEKAENAGIRFTRPSAEVEPPIKDEDIEETPLGVPPGPEVVKGEKVPLHQAAIRLPASILGRIGTEVTGYPGFSFTEGELNDLAELWMQCGVEATPQLQAAIATTAMCGGKMLGYYAWVRSGKPSFSGAKVGEEGE